MSIHKNETLFIDSTWFLLFEATPDISLRQLTSTSIARAIDHNKPQLGRLYVHFLALLDKYNFLLQRIQNMA